MSWAEERQAAKRVAEPVAVLAPLGDAPESDDERWLTPRPVDWSSFWTAARVEPEPVVPMLVNRGEIVTVAGPAKSGKSLFMQWIAVQLSMGRPVLGRRTKPTRVLYVDQENTADDWVERLLDMGVAEGAALPNLKLYHLQDWQPLTTAAGGRQLATACREHDAGLVVLDTLSKLLGDADENSANDFRALYAATLLPLKRDQRGVAVIDHTGHDTTRARGSSAKGQDVDAVWVAAKPTEGRLDVRRQLGRRRTDVETLSMRVNETPLRFDRINVDLGYEERVEECARAIATHAPGAGSGRVAAKALRSQNLKFRNDTINEAYRRHTERLDLTT